MSGKTENIGWTVRKRLVMRINAVKAAAVRVMVSLRRATSAKKPLAEILHTLSAHKHITGITGLPCSAPVFNHYMCTHTLSLTIWQEHPKKKQKKENRED